MNARHFSRSNLPVRLTFLLLIFALAPTLTVIANQHAAPSDKPNSSEIDEKLQDAQGALDRKDFQSAAELLEAIVKARPDLAPAWFNLGYAYTALGRKSDAVTDYGKALSLKPDLLQAQMNLGILLLDMSRSSEAADHLAKAVALRPDDPRTHFYYGRALAQMDKGSEAEKQFQETLRLDANSTMAACDLGQLYLKEKRFEDARLSFSRAAQLDPKLAHAQLGLALAEEGLKAPAQAAEYFEHYLAAQPDDLETRFHLAKIYLEMGKNDLALKNLERIAGTKPDLPGLAAAMGDAYALQGKFRLSELSYRRALAADLNNADLHRALGQSLLEEQKLSDAEAEFRSALKLDPHNRDAFKGLASALYLEQRYSDAIPLYESLAQNSKTPGVYFLLATCYDHLRILPKALENYERYLQLSHGLSPDQEWQARQRAKLIRDQLKK
jgi:tetratricopeptide (TPR) repeat protein